MSDVSIVFRNDSSNAPLPKPAAGELYVRPRLAGDEDRLDLARLVFERGLDGLVRGAGTIEKIIVPTSLSGPTLDDMLAATFALRLLSGESLASGAKPFADYAAVLRKGLRPGKLPVEASLEGIFLAIRNSVDEDLTNPKAAGGFLAGWSRMAERISTAIKKNEDPFVTPLFAEGSEFAEERAFLINDLNVYREDVRRGRRWLGRLPGDCLGNAAGRSNNGGSSRASVLILDRPKSLLFKYWARIDTSSPTGDGYLLLGVREAEGRWIFSTDPVQRLSLKSLADQLQWAEESETADLAGAKTDPWFDGARFSHSLIAAPKRGTCLPDSKVVSTVGKWAHAGSPRTVSQKVAIPVLAGCLLLLASVPWLPGMRAKPQLRDLGTRGDRDEPLVVTPANPVLPERSKLLVLTIGADFKRHDLVENNCKKDAENLADAFRTQLAPFFQSKRVETLVNEQATREAILAKLGSLGEDVAQGDLVIVTLAGHGTVDKYNNYFFLPYDYDKSKVLPATGVSWDDFHRVFKPLPCMVLVIADTCHSGAITRNDTRDDNDAVEASIAKAVQEFNKAEAGLVVIAASLSEERAHTNPNHGCLSQAILEGMTGQRSDVAATEPLPKPNANGVLTLENVQRYVVDRVQTLSGQAQKVIINHSGNIHMNDIPIALRRTSSTAPTTGGVQVAQPGKPAQ